MSSDSSEDVEMYRRHPPKTSVEQEMGTCARARMNFHATAVGGGGGKSNYFILSENKETTESPVRNPQDSSCLAAKQSERSGANFGFF